MAVAALKGLGQGSRRTNSRGVSPSPSATEVSGGSPERKGVQTAAPESCSAISSGSVVPQ